MNIKTPPVGNEDGRGQVAGHAGAQIDDGHPGRAAQLLHVPHEVELDQEGDEQVEEAGVEEEAGHQAVHLDKG